MEWALLVVPSNITNLLFLRWRLLSQMNGEGLGLELPLGVLLQGGKGDLWRFVEGMPKLDHYGSRMLSQDEDTKLHVDMDL